MYEQRDTPVARKHHTDYRIFLDRVIYSFNVEPASLIVRCSSKNRFCFKLKLSRNENNKAVYHVALCVSCITEILTWARHETVYA